MYTPAPSSRMRPRRRGLGAAPVATVGGRHLCENGVHFIIADDTGKRWRLEPTNALKDADCGLARIKVRGFMTGPDSIKLDGWGRLAAGEQTLTTIVGGEQFDAPPAPTDTVEVNIKGIQEGTGPLFVGDNTRSLVEQAASWTPEQEKAFVAFRDPAREAFEAYVREQAPDASAEEVAELVKEAVPDRASWNPDVRPTWDEMWGHIPLNARGPDAPPLPVTAGLPSWAPLAALAVVGALLVRGSSSRGRRA